MQVKTHIAKEAEAAREAARIAEELQQTSKQLADVQRALCQEQELRKNLAAEASEKGSRLARLEGKPFAFKSFDPVSSCAGNGLLLLWRLQALRGCVQG